VIKKEKKT